MGSPVPVVAFRELHDCVPCMTSLMRPDTRLTLALNGTGPVPAEVADSSGASGHVLAEDLRLPQDLPLVTEALRAGFAVDALDVVGASVGNTVCLDAPDRVLPCTAFPPGTDAVLPGDGIESAAGLYATIRSARPGEGARRAGDDGRKCEAILASTAADFLTGALIAPRRGVRSRAGRLRSNTGESCPAIKRVTRSA